MGENNWEVGDGAARTQDYKEAVGGGGGGGRPSQPGC